MNTQSNLYYYTNVSQCKYWFQGQYRYGIVYHKTLIDAYCGEPLDLDEVFAAARIEGLDDDDVIIELDWNNLLESIK